MPNLAIMYAVGFSHSWPSSTGGDSVRMCGFSRPFMCGMTRLGNGVRAAHLDAVHQVEPLHRHLGDGPEVDRRRVVHADVDAAELLDGLGHRGFDGFRVADVPNDRQGLAAGFLELLGGGVHGARQLRMRLGGLGDQGDVGAVLCSAFGDRQADTAAGAGDEHGFAIERHGVTLTPCSLRPDCGTAPIERRDRK